MNYLDLIFLGLGVISIIISLILLIVRAAKKTGGYTGGIVGTILIGFTCFIILGVRIFVLSDSGSGIVFNSDTSNEDKGIIENPKTIFNDGATRTITEYKYSELKYPIVTYEPGFGDAFKEYEDADGTQFKHMTMINPDGVVMGFKDITESMVLFPTEDTNKNDNKAIYHGYHYYRGSFDITISEIEVEYEPPYMRAPQLRYYDTLKAEVYDHDYMTHYGLIYNFMPVQIPAEENIVKVPLLYGAWEAYEDTIMNGKQLLARLEFSDDGSLVFDNNIVNESEVPYSSFYKLEYLDENAYKLYLYFGGPDNEGNFVILDEPCKRNFIIYVTSEDTFELVYYDNQLNRHSITMIRT